jgi:hypothetical protein
VKYAALLLLLVSGCATTATRPWVDDDKLRYDPSRYVDDAAVVLYRSDKTALELQGSESFTRRERHEVTVVRGEAGFWLAEVSVPYRAQDRLLGFQARLIQPDGTRREFDAKNFLSDVSAKGERTVNAHFFRFPEVKVGSVLEYWWVVEGDRFWNADEQETLGEFPVQLYEFELTAAKPLVVETIEFNGASPIEVRSRANGEHQLRFSLRDLPRRERVDHMPHFSFTEPRWAWRVLAWRQGKLSYDWLREWTDVVESNGERFYVSDDTLKGFDATLDRAGCNDVPCLVARAQSFIHSRVVGGGSWNRAEPLAQALASGKASVVERALMARVLLERAGVEAWLAYGTDALSVQLAPSFPRLAQFDHLFVYLPAQKGLAAPMTVDLDCGFCKPGELTARHRDQRIFVFRTEREISDLKTVGRWETALATPAPRSERRFTHLATLDAEGAVRDVVTTRTTGLEAGSEVEQFEQHRERLKQRESDEWNRASGLKVMQEATWGSCERAKGQCEWSSKLTFPGHAWRSGAGWSVQLGFLNAAHDELFDAEERKVDLHFKWDDTATVEVLELEAPPGTKLQTVPAPVFVSAGSLRATVDVERTEKGARVTRKLERVLGFESKSRYPELRAAADAFKRARFLVLTFAP